MKKHANIYASTGTSYHGHYIIATPERLIELFGVPQLTDTSCDGGQMEWIMEHDGNCITIYDRCRSPYRLDQAVRYNIGAHDWPAAQGAQEHLERLVTGENFDTLWSNLKESIK